ncbi:MAG: hypothetical protein HGA45_43330 [Chloroflexales bacterium]|nr:hypothetical protein [Chloroflexales bacterium]
MLTVDQIVAYSEHAMAAKFLAGDREGLRRLQLALGVLMEAAQEAGDRESQTRFRNLAAKVANKQEALEDKA